MAGHAPGRDRVLKPEYRLVLARDGYALVKCELAVFKPEQEGVSEMNKQIVQAGAWRSALLTVVLIVGIQFWVLTAANLVGDFGLGRIDATAVDILGMIVLMALPMLVAALVQAWIKRRD